jgi:uncharacterized protein (TIRG00374 family)
MPSVLSELRPPARPSLHPFWKYAATFALAGVTLYLAFRGVDWRQVGRLVAHCRVRYLLLGLACGAASYIVRAMRWRMLLSAREKLPPATVLWANAVGYLANNYLPARAGELVRTVMISSRSQLTKAYVFTTAMTERVVELVILVLMAWGMSLTLPYRPAWVGRLMLLVAVGAIGGTAFLLLLPRMDRAREGLIARLPGGLRLKERLHDIAESVTLALNALRDPSRLARVAAVTAVVWTLDATAAVIAAHAMGMQLMFPVALLLGTGLALGNALPSTPGALGISQFVAVTVLMPFGFTHTDAIAYILVAQAGNYVVITILGLVGLWRYRVSEVPAVATDPVR